MFFRLDTGHSILHALFCEESLARCLPLSQVWIALIAAACQHTGAERLKVVCLLMKLLNIHGSGTTEDVVKEKLELSALKPLWQLYTTMIKKFGKYVMMVLFVYIHVTLCVLHVLTPDSEAKTKQLLAPELIRVFTELFLTVEDLSEVRQSHSHKLDCLHNEYWCTILSSVDWCYMSVIVCWSM